VEKVDQKAWAHSVILKNTQRKKSPIGENSLNLVTLVTMFTNPRSEVKTFLLEHDRKRQVDLNMDILDSLVGSRQILNMNIFFKTFVRDKMIE
jgi:hypothetical protein